MGQFWVLWRWGIGAGAFLNTLARGNTPVLIPGHIGPMQAIGLRLFLGTFGAEEKAWAYF